MYPSTEPIVLSTAHPFQAANSTNSPPSTASYPFLSSPPKIKRKPQPIATRCSPPRTLPRAISRRRSSISGSPAFQTASFSIIPTPISESFNTPQLTSYGYTASFAPFPPRGSPPCAQKAQVPLARRIPSSPKRSQHSLPSAPPSPTRPRARAKYTITRDYLPTPPPPSPLRTFKLSRIRSLTNLRSRAPPPAPTLRTTSTRPTMTTTPAPKVTSKRAKRSATPARGSAAFTKYRPMPFIQQMQMIQFMEGGTLDSHIRRHHVHEEQVTAHGYSFTDERGMIWFDEEEEWEFTSLLPLSHQRPPPHKGIKRLFGKRRDEESGDEWEDFVDEEEAPYEDVNPEVLLARGEDALRVLDDDLGSFGGALESPWTTGNSGSSVLKLPKPKTERKRERAGRVISPVPPPLPELVPATTRPREQVAALRNEFLATAFTPPSARTVKTSRATNLSRLFTNSTSAGGQRLTNVKNKSQASLLNSLAAETPGRTPSLLPISETHPAAVAPSPAEARCLGIGPSTLVAMQPCADPITKQSFKTLRGCFNAVTGM